MRRQVLYFPHNDSASLTYDCRGVDGGWVRRVKQCSFFSSSSSESEVGISMGSDEGGGRVLVSVLRISVKKQYVYYLLG